MAALERIGRGDRHGISYRTRADLNLRNGTYLRIKGKDRYLYRAVDSTGQTIEFLLTARRDTAAAKLGKSCEITRFKGLGEISPKEFAQFIGKEMKLSKVEYAPKHDVSNILTFYMGKNTPERKDFIMGNLVVPVEA